METRKDTSTKSTEKMTRVQKVIVILTFVVLAIILIVFAATRYMGSSTTYPIDTPPGFASNDETTDDSKNDTVHSGDTESDGEKTDGNGQQDTGKTGGTQQNPSDDNRDENDGQTENNNQSDDNSENQDDGGKDDSNGDGNTTDTDKDQNTGEDKDDSSDDNGGETDDSNNDTGDKDDTSGGNTSSGISSGDSVTITAIGESAVTVQIGGETVIIPVQTTIFNGRVTKSGVISDSLCGYNIGASVMLYYPENGSLEGVTLTGAYVKADSTRLTVSGDYNGDGSKIVFRVNGVRLP